MKELKKPVAPANCCLGICNLFPQKRAPPGSSSKQPEGSPSVAQGLCMLTPDFGSLCSGAHVCAAAVCVSQAGGSSLS